MNKEKIDSIIENISSRDIDFKVWDKENKCWYGFEESPQQGDRFILCQYTVLKDKNGDKIYDGDIVKGFDVASDKYAMDGNNREIWVVEWYQPRASFMPRDYKVNHRDGRYIHHWDMIGEIEVIGNIFENPELLDE